MDSAVEILRTDRSRGDDLGAVIVYLPERLTRHGARLLRAVADGRGLTVLAGTSGDRRADAEVVLAVERLDGPQGTDASAPGVDPMAVVSADRTRIMTVSDADEEVREAVRAVIDAVRGGTPLDRIAILHASPEPYARLAYEQLSAAGLAMNGASVMPLTARVAGRTLLGLLALPDGDFRRDEVFSWLAGARLRYDGRPIPVTAWERISRDVGVVAGRGQWDRLLTRFADDRDASATLDDADPDAPPWRAERSRTEALLARGLRAFVLALIDDLASARARPRALDPSGDVGPTPLGSAPRGRHPPPAVARGRAPGGRAGRPGHSTVWAAWMPSKDPRTSTSSGARSSSSSTPTLVGSAEWVRACWLRR